jgi:hypothetical protein
LVRTDIQGEPRAPKSYEEFLRRVGGKNPYGELQYRLVYTDTRFQSQAGMWKDWDPTLSIQERGGMIQNDHGYMIASAATPDRVLLEVRDVLKYPHMPERWILERWCPAHYYGSKASWESLVVPETTLPLMGPFPEFGDYEMVAGPAEELPSHTYLKQAIEACEELREEHRGTVEQVIAERVSDAEYAYEQQSRAEMEENVAFFRDQLSPWGSSSLAAGRWRQDLANRAGVKEHAGN